MFSLIIAIVSIALVVAVVIVGSYFGGSGISDATAQVEAARLKNEEQQILAAVDVFNADKGRYPNDVHELVDAGYLNSIPRGAQVAAAAQLKSGLAVAGLLVVSQAYAAEDVSLGWSAPVSGQPVFQTSATVPQLVCAKYNQATRGDDGILKQAFSSQRAQCYGVDGEYRVVINKLGSNTINLAEALGQGQVLEGALPAKSGTVFWDKQPSEEVKAPTDPDKTAVAKLEVTTTGSLWGKAQVGETQSIGRVIVSNAGNSLATNVSVSAPEGFSIDSSSCASTLAPGASCSFNIAVLPTAAQSYGGDVVIASGNAGSPKVAVTGAGQAPSATLSSIDFGSVNVGASVKLAATLTNTGIGPLTVTKPNTASASTTAGFYVGRVPHPLLGDCDGVLAPGATCQVPVSFIPPNAGPASGTLSINAGNAGVVTSTLTGMGLQSRLTLSYPNHSLGSDSIIFTTYIGQPEGSGTFTLTNSGNSKAEGVSLGIPAGWQFLDGTCDSTLAAGASCTFRLSFSPTEVKTYSGDLSVSSSNSVSAGSYWVIGNGLELYSTATLTSASSQSVGGWYGEDLKSVSFTYRNDGNGTMSLSTPGLSAPLSVTSNSCSGIAPGSSCSMKVTWTSQAAGAGGSSYQVFVPSGATNAPAAARVDWTIYSAVPQWSTTSLNFGNVTVGSSSTQNITLYNQGSAAYNWMAHNAIANLPSGFSFNLSACSNVAPGGGSCNVVVTFSPTAAGSYGGDGIRPEASFAGNYLSVSGTGLPQSAALSGIAFGARNAGTATDLTSTLTNTGSGSLSVTPPNSASVTGTGFTFVSTTCGSSLAAGANCTTTVRYAASGTAPASGQLAIVTGASTKTAALSGQSLQAVLSLNPTSMNFGSVTIGATSAGQTLTVTNTGNTTLTGLAGGVSANSNDWPYSGTCGTTISAGASCTLTFKFRPSSAGGQAPNYNIYGSNASRVAMNLSGTGVDDPFFYPAMTTP